MSCANVIIDNKGGEMKRKSALFVLLYVCFCNAAYAQTQSYPAKPVRLVVPYSAGGPTDTLARIVAQKLTTQWGEQVIVDNRPGANSIIGTEIVARSEPDGYTLLVALPAFAINSSIYKKLPYDTLRDLLPISMLGTAGYAIVVNASLPVKSIRDLVALAKARPGELSFGSGGIGSPAHLAIELFKQKAGVKMEHVPYKGGAPALLDLTTGQIQLMANPIGSSMPFIKSGKLRAIAVTSDRRSQLLPNVPTVSESGMSTYHVSTWYGVFAPAKTGSPVVQIIAKSLSIALKDPGIIKRFTEFAVEPIGNDPATFSKLVREEIARWAKIIKTANIAH